MRIVIPRRTVLALEFALGLIFISILVSGCFQAVGAAQDLTPGLGTPTLGALVQPTPIVVQPTQDTSGLFPPTSNAPPTMTAVVVAQAPTAVAQSQDDPAITQTLVQQTLNAQATEILAGVTLTAAFENTLAATQLGTGLPPGVQPNVPATAVPAAGQPKQPVATIQPQGTPGEPGSGAAGSITGDCKYTVVENDRLFRIALRFGLTVRQVALDNRIVNPDMLSVGQVLFIRECTIPKTQIPLPAAGTTGDQPQAAAAVPASGSASGQTYVVQEGDSLYSIATKFGVKVAALAQANNITNINVIYIGQTLTIP